MHMEDLKSEAELVVGLLDEAGGSGEAERVAGKQLLRASSADRADR